MKKKNNWSFLFIFLKNRTTIPFGNPKYVMYFIFIIVLVGSFGLFYDLLNIDFCFPCEIDSKKVISFAFNMTNISLSLITASVIDLIFISRKDITESKFINQSKGVSEVIKGNVRFFGLSSLILSFILWILVNNLFNNIYIKLILATFSLLFSYWIWWISNVKNKILREVSTNVLAAVGGSLPFDGITKGAKTSAIPIDEDDITNNHLRGNLDLYKS